MIKGLIVLGVVAFASSVGVAMFVYPGGTWWDVHATGHSFWQNFLCDLLRDPALNHRDNSLGAVLTKVGMLFIVGALSLNWFVASQWLHSQRNIRRAVRWLGAFGTPLVAAVPAYPSDAFPALHTIAVTLGGLPALVTLLLFNGGVLREPRCPNWLRATTTVLTLLSVSCLGLYVRESVFREPSLRVLPILERLATLTAMVWIIVPLRSTPTHPPRAF